MRFQRFDFKDLESARRFIISLRRNLSQEFIRFMSQSAQREILNSDVFKMSSTIACFVGAKGEPDTSLIINQREKNIFLPKVTSEGEIGFFLYKGQMKEGKFGIPEPDSSEAAKIDQIELFIVPGVLFDIRGLRVGYGKGYYDKALSKRSAKSKIFALAWSFQVFEKIPYEKPEDVFVHRIYTEIYTLDVESGTVYPILNR